MAIIKRLKNTSGSGKFILTRTVANLEYYYIPVNLWVQVLEEVDILDDVNSGDLTVNDGDVDLSITQGIDWLNRFETDSIDPDLVENNRIKVDIGDSLIIGPQGPQGDQGPQGIQGIQGVPGGSSSYTYNESEAESTTTSRNYQQKLKLTTPSLLQGNYLIQWYCEITSTDNDGVSCIVELDDSTTIAEIEDDRHHSEDYFKPFSGMKQVTLSSGVHEIDIDYKKEGGTAKIRRARISITGVN